MPTFDAMAADMLLLFVFLTALVFFVVYPVLLGSGFAQGQPASLRGLFEVADGYAEAGYLAVAPALCIEHGK